MARVYALQEQGESFLAERQLRGLLLYDEDPQVRREAAGRLRQFYRRAGQLLHLEQLAAFMVLREPTSEHLALLADALLENGRYDFALSAALLVAEPQRPLETVLRAAVQEGWWQVFNHHLQLLPDESERHYWQAVRCVRHGAYRAGLDHYIKAGELGQSYAQHLTWGFEIHRQLCSSDVSARSATVSAWRQWLAEHPGPYLWQEDSSLVSSYCGADSVYSVARDTYAQYFRAEPERTVKLEVMGPARLKLEVRPLHDAQVDEPLNDWIHLRTGGEDDTIPITENRPNLGLRVIGSKDQLPGQQLEPELSIGAGLQQIEIHAESRDLLVRVFVRRPEQPLSVLPPFTQATLDTVLAGKFTKMVDLGARTTQLHLLPDTAGSKINVLPILCQPTVPAQDNVPPSNQPLPVETPSPSDKSGEVEEFEESDESRLHDCTEPVAKRRARAGDRVIQASALAPVPFDPDSTRDGFATAENVHELKRLSPGARILPLPTNVGLGSSAALRRLPPAASARTFQFDETRPGARGGIVKAGAWGTWPGEPIMRTSADDPNQPADVPLTFLHDSMLADDKGSSTGTDAAIRLVEDPVQFQPVPSVPFPDPAGESVSVQSDVTERQTAPPDLNVSPTPLDSTATVEQLARRMRDLLWLTERGFDSQDAYRVRGLTLFTDHRENLELGQLHRRLMRGTSWRLFSQFEGSAGIRIVQVPRRWAPESPSLRVRTALLSPLDDEDQLLVGNDRFVVAFHNTQPTLVDLSLRLESVPYVPAEPITVFVQVNDAETRQLKLDPQRAGHLITVASGAGPQKIATWVERPRTNQYLRVRANIRHQDAGPAVERLTGTLELEQPHERYYHVATHDEPVRFRIFGPAWLRIDELRDDTTYTKYIAINGGSEAIDLRPSGDRREALFRVFALVTTPGEENTYSPWVPVTAVSVPPPVIPFTPNINVVDSSVGPAEAVLAMSTPELSPPAVFLDDLYVLGGQEDASWSFASSWVSRRSLEEGSRGLAPDQFAQFDLTRRFLSPETGSYHESDLLYRERSSSGSTLGIQHHLRYEPDLGRWHLWLGGNAFVQEPSGAIAPATRDTEWSTTLRGSLVRFDQLTPKLGQLTSLAAFNRWLSLDENIYQPGRIDQDIFTPYKSQHHRGFAASHTLLHRPWLDTRWWLRGVLRTNEDFDPTSPDSLGLRVGWSQFWGAAEFDVSYRLTQYFEDGDRPDPFTQNLLYLSMVADCWQSPRHRYELGTQVLHDLGKSETSVFVFFAWHFDNGRDYRDFSPVDTLFRSMRRFRAARRPNNQLLLVDG